MAQAYCEVCAVEVTVREGRCLVGHRVHDEPRPARPGRHRASRRVLPTAPQDRPAPPLAPAEPGPLVSQPHEGPSYRLPVLEILGFSESEFEFTGRVPGPPPADPGHPEPERGAVRTATRADTWSVRLSDVTPHDEEEVDTGKLIQRLWEASDTGGVEDSDQWTPHEFTPTGGASFRWSVVILVLLLVAGAGALLVAATKVPESQARAVAERYEMALEGMRELVDPAREAAQVVTSPTATPDQLSEAVLPLARLEARALDVTSVATQQLPNPPPLALSRPIDALVPVRQELLRSAEQAQVAADRLTAVLDYRLLMGRAFRLPPLPLSTSSEEVSELGVDLAVALADSIDILSQLPDDPFFDGHRRQAEAAVRELEEIQAAYLDALRQEDVDRATELAARIDQVVTEVHDLSGPLAEAAAWADEALGELERLLQQTTVLLGQIPV